MKMNLKILAFSLPFLILNSCVKQNPNLNKSGEDELKTLEIENPIDKEQINFKDVIYVPIYSDIYIDQTDPKRLLSATLSIRNTSFTDSLYISKINYYNTEGSLVREYLNNSIFIKPMGTINYVIEKEDEVGGSGANFIVELSAKNHEINPLIQAIMIGKSSNHSFSFVTDGYPIKKRKSIK